MGNKQSKKKDKKDPVNARFFLASTARALISANDSILLLNSLLETNEFIEEPGNRRAIEAQLAEFDSMLEQVLKHVDNMRKEVLEAQDLLRNPRLRITLLAQYVK